MSLRKLKKAYKKAESGKKLTTKEMILVKRGNQKTEAVNKPKKSS